MFTYGVLFFGDLMLLGVVIIGLRIAVWSDSPPSVVGKLRTAGTIFVGG